MELMLVLVAFILLIGLIGCIIPIIPGPPISFLGFLLLNFFTSYNFSKNTIWILAFIVIIITFLDYWIQVYGVKRFGGGQKAINGTIIGLLIGIFFFPPFGVIIGPFTGALAGAIMEEKNDARRVVVIALGALVGFLSGTLLKLSYSIYIIFMFIRELWIL
tara:strand:- start:15082 stop:15564 length:483 start_codon:yes stop_codon:yes gene_type:complete